MNIAKHKDSLIGLTFGKLFVVGIDDTYKNSRAMFYKCKCTCGNERSIRQDKLKSGRANKCGECIKNSNARGYQYYWSQEMQSKYER